MGYWLLKTEPEEWSWDNQVTCDKKGSVWDGVRNFQARNNLKAMKLGDRCFFYHTGKEKKLSELLRSLKNILMKKMIELENLCPLWFVLSKNLNYLFI